MRASIAAAGGINLISRRRHQASNSNSVAAAKAARRTYQHSSMAARSISVSARKTSASLRTRALIRGIGWHHARMAALSVASRNIMARLPRANARGAALRLAHAPAPSRISVHSALNGNQRAGAARIFRAAQRVAATGIYDGACRLCTQRAPRSTHGISARAHVKIAYRAHRAKRAIAS